jgi:hypothetical protein
VLKPLQDRDSLQQRLTRIRANYADFGIAGETHLFRLVRDKAEKSVEHSAEGEVRAELDSISQWTDEQCRQCMVVRGGRRYRTFVDLVCRVFADLDLSDASADEKLGRYRNFVWTADVSPTPAIRIGDALAQAEEEAGKIIRSLKQANFGEDYLETVHREIADVARSYDWTPPRQVIERIAPLWRELAPRLSKDRHPRPERALFTFAGQVHGLFSYAALYLDDVNRARAFAGHCLQLAELAGAENLQAWACGTLSMLYRFEDLDADALAIAEQGLALSTKGPLKSRLYSAAAESAAKLGDSKAVNRYLGHSLDEHGAAASDSDALELAGIFGFSEAKVRYYVGSALLELESGGEVARRAASHSEEAATLFGDEDGIHRSYPDFLVAQGHIARARYQLGDLDGVKDALQKLLCSPTESRTSWHRKMLRRIDRALDGVKYSGSKLGKEVQTLISEFETPAKGEA